MFIRFFLISFILGIFLSLYAEVYEWVDNDGKTHFGDRKNHGVELEILNLEYVIP